MNKKLLAVMLLILGALLPATSADEMKAFPPAEQGMVRYVLNIQKQDDESEYRVELIAGKTVRVDAVNRYFFGGGIEAETIEGWGYTRYVVGPLGPMAGTLMAVDPKAPKKGRFVSLGGEPYLIRYNSRLPVVVYAPEGVEIRYRIWSAGKLMKTMEKG